LDEESLYVSDAQGDAVIKKHSGGRIGAVFWGWGTKSVPKD
jgi:hypothetical protein